MNIFLNEIWCDISWRQIANKYLHRHSSWLYQKLRGVDEEGNPTSFSPEEIGQLRDALIDLSERIRWCADGLLLENSKKEVMAKKKYIDVETMTDEEFETLSWVIGGERADIPTSEPDTRFTERHDSPTPNGGDYSIAYYYNDDGPCDKKEATRVNIVEYKKGGIRINEVYGMLDSPTEKD